MDKSKTPFLELASHSLSQWVSTATALICVSAFLITWLIAGPIIHFEEAWHLFITTSSAAITLFMVFILTRAQTKDSAAMQVKLNEIISVLEKADNEIMKLEHMTEAEIAEISRQKLEQ